MVDRHPIAGNHLYALDTGRLDLPMKVSLEAFTNAVEPHTLTTVDAGWKVHQGQGIVTASEVTGWCGV